MAIWLGVSSHPVACLPIPPRRDNFLGGHPVKSESPEIGKGGTAELAAAASRRGLQRGVEHTTQRQGTSTLCKIYGG